ncbi:hypothetical protein ACIP39_17025 [Streptomyces tibetensis]|uniref:hypothetical protein n=1 Tax=Streptomyces tibetensis TaxID=2382123 RepID=UPI0038028DEF
MPGRIERQSNARLSRLRNRQQRFADLRRRGDQTPVRVDWARLGTVVAVIAGIGTLLFSGVATYYQAIVSRNQLEQSRDESVRQKQDQASRVSFWENLDGASPNKLELHLMNRSPDPVPNVKIFLHAQVKPAGKQATTRIVSLDDLNLAPCTEVVFTKGTLAYYEGDRLQPVGSATWGAIAFEDRNAVGWIRTRSLLYSSDQEEEAEQELENSGNDGKPHTGRILKIPQQARISNCGAN